MCVEQHTIFFNYKIELKIGFDKSLTNSILIDTRFINIFPKRIEACESVKIHESRRIFLRIFSLYQRDIRSIISHRYFSSKCVVNKKNSRGENCKGSMEERDLFDRGMYACNKRILDVGRSALRFSFGSFSFGRIADEIAWSGPIVGGHKQSLTVRGRSPNRFPPTAKAIPIKPPFLKRVSI